jgi:hypothetical protein
MVRRGLGLVACSMVACVPVPDFDPPGSVHWEYQNGGGAVTGQNFSIHFASNDTFHYPDSLVLGGVELLSRDSNAACNVEDLAGMGFYPACRIGPSAMLAPTISQPTSQIDPVLLGPAVGKVEVRWSATLPCAGPSPVLSGYSAFTIFPDAKIVRYDDVDASSESSVMSYNCDCQQAGAESFFITSFWALDRGGFDTIYLDGDSTPLEDVTAVTTNNSASYDCLERRTAGAAHTVAVAWRRATRVTAPSGTATIGLSDDLVPPTQSFPVLTATKDYSSSAMFLSQSEAGCTSRMNEVDGYNGLAEQLRVNGEPVAAARDGIYGGDQAGDGGAGVPVEGRVELASTNITAAFAVWLHWEQIVDGLTIESSSPKSGTWYIPQRLGDNDWIVWFRDGLQGTTITVDPT